MAVEPSPATDSTSRIGWCSLIATIRPGRSRPATSVTELVTGGARQLEHPAAADVADSGELILGQSATPVWTPPTRQPRPARRQASQRPALIR